MLKAIEKKQKQASSSSLERVNITLSRELREYLAEYTSARGVSLSEYLRELVEAQRKADLKASMRRVAEELREDYMADAELTAFTSLDGEPTL